MHKERRDPERSDYISQQRREDNAYGRNNTSGVKGSDDGGRARGRVRQLEKFYEKTGGSNDKPSGANDFSEMDIAQQILSAAGKPVHYKILIGEVLARENKSANAAAVSELYTMLNMDRRFRNIGAGMWTLA